MALFEHGLAGLIPKLLLQNKPEFLVIEEKEDSIYVIVCFLGLMSFPQCFKVKEWVLDSEFKIIF